MSGQPLGEHEAEKRIRQPNPVRPARPPDQAHAALAATTPFRFSGFVALLWSKFPVAVKWKVLWSTVFLERKRT
jgi:hypothetical protein